MLLPRYKVIKIWHNIFSIGQSISKPVSISKKINSQYFCTKKQDKNGNTQSDASSIKNSDKIQISKQELQMMYKFMTDTNLSTPQKSNLQEQEANNQSLNNGVQNYFQSPEQLISLAILKLSSPQQFISYFKKHMNQNQNNEQQEHSKIKLLILYQYWKIGGLIKPSPKISQNPSQVQEYAYQYMKFQLNKQRMEMLDELQLQNLLLIYQNYKNSANSSVNLLPKQPPIINQYKYRSTSLLKILVESYKDQKEAITKIISHYTKPQHDAKDDEQIYCRFSCWEMLHVYLVAHYHYSSFEEVHSIENAKMKMEFQFQLQSIGKQIIREFDNQFKDQKLIQEEQEAQILKFSLVPFLELYLKNIQHLEPSLSTLISLYEEIFIKRLIQYSRKQQLPLKMLIPVLYTTVITLEQLKNDHTNSQAISRIQSVYTFFLNEILDRFKSSKSQTIKYSHYMLSWKIVMVINKMGTNFKADAYKLIQCLIQQLANNQIAEIFSGDPQYSEDLMQKENQLFEMLVTYRMVLLNDLKLENYSLINQQVTEGRSILIRLLIELRRTYQKSYLSQINTLSLDQNIIIVSMIANYYSQEIPKNRELEFIIEEGLKSPISIFLSPTIKEALTQCSKKFEIHRKFINNLLDKYKS